MKKYLKISRGRTLLILLVFLQACYLDPFRETVYGDGTVTRISHELDQFSGINVSSGIDVYLRMSENFEVVVEADENLHEYIRVWVQNGTLVVDTDANIRQASSKKVYVGMPELRRIDISSAGNVRGEGLFECDGLDISISSAGDLRLEVEAEKIRITLSSAGDAVLTGKSVSLDAGLSSAGSLRADELVVKYADVRVSSAGNAWIFVTDELDASSSSSGDIYYKGNPSIKNVRVSSSGRIKSL